MANAIPDQVWYVYLLLCEHNTIYAGVTPSLPHRMRAHLSGKGARFTRMNRPIRLLAAKPYANKRSALQVESSVKRMPAQGKRILAGQWSEQYPVDQTTQELFARE
ncbi:MAG: GIY-YIG nuclease family protein [Rhodanobacteraceae bacterium]|nr:MAG: GIY-YIG nuclease family protein [Rhodanobacteraceae bacterium]